MIKENIETNNLLTTARERYRDYINLRNRRLKGDTSQVYKAIQIAKKLNINLLQMIDNTLCIELPSDYLRLAKEIVDSQTDGWWLYAREIM